MAFSFGKYYNGGKKMDRIDGYEVVGSFDYGNRHMVVIKAAHGTHVMPCDEWEMMKSGRINNIKSCDKKENSNVA